MEQVLSACGPISVSFFTVVVFFGSFYLLNLMLAVVALSYEEEAEITNEVLARFKFHRRTHVCLALLQSHYKS